MAQISVLVADDSVVVRRLVTAAIDSEADLRVVATAPDGKVALAKLDQVAPDVVTLDIEMPVMDGLATLRALRRTHPRLPVIMFSTLTQRGASATPEALSSRCLRLRHQAGERRQRQRVDPAVCCRPRSCPTSLPALPRFDIVFLRNVLIHFDTATKRGILQRIRASHASRRLPLRAEVPA